MGNHIIEQASGPGHLVDSNPDSITNRLDQLAAMLQAGSERLAQALSKFNPIPASPRDNSPEPPTLDGRLNLLQARIEGVCKMAEDLNRKL